MSPSPAALDAARAVADAVLYEGYLLYPYRAGTVKNRSRWQFGVLGPPAATPSAFTEPPDMSMQCLLTATAASRITIRLRFLQLQARTPSASPPCASPPCASPPCASPPCASPPCASPWDEAVEREITFPDLPLRDPLTFTVTVPGGEDVEPGTVRRRWPLRARVTLTAETDHALTRLTVAVSNEHPEPVIDKQDAVHHSLIAAHLLLEARDAAFVSVREPIPAATRCRQHRCWPVLAGPPGETGLLLGAPIILYDHPRLAEQSPGALFDACEIDELLTLRVRTMTDTEKAEARATDPRAAEIIDRCDSLTADELLRLHGTRRDPADAPALSRGTLVRLRPSRRADAQDMFLTGRIAVVNQVLTDVDDTTHVAVALIDDPAAELHDWYGRYLHFAPSELEPLAVAHRPLNAPETAAPHSHKDPAVAHRRLGAAETAAEHSHEDPAVAHRRLGAAETAVEHSHKELAVAHRCLNAAETAVEDSHGELAVAHRCLGAVETAVRDSWGDSVLVAGIGNVFLGDDGFGPEVVRHLGHGEPLPDGVRVADYGIRGLHLAHDLLAGYDVLILVDALPNDGAPGRVEVIEVDPAGVGAGEFDGHGMDPLAVLAGVARLGGTLPDTYVVGCRVATVDETIGLSEPVAAAVPIAADAVRALLTRLFTVQSAGVD